MAYGVTDTGFNRPTLQQLVTDVENEYKAEYGNDVDLSLDGPIGIEVGIKARMLDKVWQVAEDDYNSQNPNTATGNALFNIGAFNNIPPKSLSPTLVNVSFKGDNATAIGINTQVSQSVAGKVFKTTIAKILSQQAANLIDLSVTLEDSVPFVVLINNVSYSYTSDGSATYSEIINGLKALIDAAAIGVEVTNIDTDAGTFTLESTDKADTYKFIVNSRLTILKVQSIIEVSCLTLGAVAAPATSIDTIATSVSGLDSVTNYFDGQIGIDTETSEEFRARREDNITNAGANYPSAIKSRIENGVAGVSFCRVYDNRTMSVVDSIDPKTIEAVVEGGQASKLAEILWKNKAAGIGFSGEESEFYIDSEGVSQQIKYTRPSNLYLWVKVTITAYNSEEDFPIDGEGAIKQNCAEYGNDNFNIGDDIILQKMNKPVFDVEGIGQVTIELASTAAVDDVPSYGSSNIVISKRQRAVFDVARVEVVL